MMNREYWIDGFNFFHHWDATRGLLRPDSGLDIVRAINRSLGILSRHLGAKARYSVVYLDGGLSRHNARAAGLAVRYCGPGRKADDRLAEDLAELGRDAKLVTAVSNDRELKAALRGLGASCLGVGEFLAVVEGRKKQAAGKKGEKPVRSSLSKGDEAEIMREKTKSLSAHEVSAWMEYFGFKGEEDGESDPQ